MASAHPDWHLAELNIGRLHEPLDHPDIAEFAAALDHVNALAEGSPGFVWRLTDESGRSSSCAPATIRWRSSTCRCGRRWSNSTTSCSAAPTRSTCGAAA